MTGRIASAAVLASIAVAAAAFSGSAAVAQTGRGMTYGSLADLPDFSGAWLPVTPLFTPDGQNSGQPLSLPREVRPEVAAKYLEGRKQLMAGASVDRGYCAPPAFSGQMPMTAGGSLEILFTPGQVTIAVEAGLVRRIYLRDSPPPEALDESRGGTSIGRWEGDTLVVDTTGLSRNADFMPGVPVGRNARSVERISLKDADTLEIESRITAPEVLVAPLTAVNRYRRARGRLFTEFDTCVQSDRSFDAASKLERFDVTPPADLPPPPGPD